MKDNNPEFNHDCNEAIRFTSEEAQAAHETLRKFFCDRSRADGEAYSRKNRNIFPFSHKEQTMNKNILLYEQTLIACRAFFPDSEKSFHGIMCYKDGQPAVFVEIKYDWDGCITYGVWFYPDHSKSVYSVSYDRMCSRLKYLARIL